MPAWLSLTNGGAPKTTTSIKAAFSALENVQPLRSAFYDPIAVTPAPGLEVSGGWKWDASKELVALHRDYDSLAVSG